MKLGMDQEGELHIAVMSHLVDGETYTVEPAQPEPENYDGPEFWIYGSKGTNLLASLNGEGKWLVQEVQIEQIEEDAPF